MTHARWSALRASALVLVVAMGMSAVTAVQPEPVEAQRRGSRVRIDQPFNGKRPFELEFHGGFAWWGYGFATGARFGIPIMHNGFIPSLNNAVYINFGADAYYIGYDRGPRRNRVYGWGLGFPIALHWEFYFHERWSAFAEFGANIMAFHPRYFDDRRFYFDARHWFIAAVGGNFHINETIALQLRLGLPYASFGLAIHF